MKKTVRKWRVKTTTTEGVTTEGDSVTTVESVTTELSEGVTTGEGVTTEGVTTADRHTQTKQPQKKFSEAEIQRDMAYLEGEWNSMASYPGRYEHVSTTDFYFHLCTEGYDDRCVRISRATGKVITDDCWWTIMDAKEGDDRWHGMAGMFACPAKSVVGHSLWMTWSWCNSKNVQIRHTYDAKVKDGDLQWITRETKGFHGYLQEVMPDWC